MVKKVLLGLLVVAVVVAGGVAVWFFQLTAPVKVSNTPPVAATLVVSQTVGVGATTTAVAARVYRIDPSRSWAAYRVDETFFDVRGLVTVTGTTSAVAGEILLDPQNPSASRVGEIVVDISQLRTDEPSRDNAIRRGWLESARYPLATFNNATMSGLPAKWTEGEPFAFEMAGDMTVREATRPVTWEVKATVEGDEVRGRATTQLKMSDFGVEPPSLMDLKVEDDIALTLEFVAVAVESGSEGGDLASCVPSFVMPGELLPFEGGYPPVRASVGTGHMLRGVVRSSKDCAPIANAKLIIWLANSQGQYDDDHRATMYTDEAGKYMFESNFPGVYDRMRPHIHFYVSAEGHKEAVLEYLAEEGRSEGTFDVVLAHEGE
ncbi:MAG TPA: YceI family protein [Chloroflexia bacterium]|jgi:polyisoprenoid-binding protein YceI